MSIHDMILFDDYFFIQFGLDSILSQQTYTSAAEPMELVHMCKGMHVYGNMTARLD